MKCLFVYEILFQEKDLPLFLTKARHLHRPTCTLLALPLLLKPSKALPELDTFGFQCVPQDHKDWDNPLIYLPAPFLPAPLTSYKAHTSLLTALSLSELN